ncbi:hypothetical protein [Laceyella putida]|uniref:Inhibitor of sigma-G Gin n=1 Tax=Laceyella putida TaxID=110101 RepID=A0ABW2RPG4_9BACL
MTGLLFKPLVIAFGGRGGGQKKKVDICPHCHVPGGQVEKVEEQWLCHVCESVMSEEELDFI